MSIPTFSRQKTRPKGRLRAFCWAGGQIEFGTKVPDGALLIARGPAKLLREKIDALARHGYRPGVLLVPGIPEASKDSEKLKALRLFKDGIEARISRASGIEVDA